MVENYLKYKWVVNFSKNIVGNISDIELEIVSAVSSEKYPVYWKRKIYFIIYVEKDPKKVGFGLVRIHSD